MMGLYACQACIDEHGLDNNSSLNATCVAACEVCGHVRDDWHVQHCTFISDLHRPLLGRGSVQEQLEDRKAAAQEELDRREGKE